MSLLRLSFYICAFILLEHTKWALLVSLTKGAVILRKLTWQGPNNGLWPTASKKSGPLVIQSQGNKVCQQPE